MSAPEPKLEEATKTPGLILTLREVMNSQLALRELASLPLRAKVAFQVAKVIKLLAPEVEICTAQQQALLDKYGTPVEGQPGNYKFEPLSQREEFNKEYDSLLDLKVTVNIQTLKIDDLGEASISGGALAALGWLITE